MTSTDVRPITADDLGWREKASKIIARLCADAYRQVNYDAHGRKFRKYRPYHIPTTAEALVSCLNTNDEARAKAIFMRVLDLDTMHADHKSY